MQRNIRIDVTGNRASASARELGTQGEVAAVSVALTFDGSWNGLAKRLLWRAADGSASAYTLLGSPDADGVYTVSVPALPLSVAGRAELTVEGVETDGGEIARRARSVLLTFRVEPNDCEADSEAEAVDATVAEQLASAIEGKADADHTHTKSDISDFSHTHAQSEVSGLTSALSGKAAASHTHTKSAITDFSHTHAQSEVSGLTSALSGKAAASHTHTKSAITDFAHTHTQSEVSGLTSALSGKAAASHTHTKSAITDFSHTHTKSEITDFAHTHEVAAADVTYPRGGSTFSVKTALDAALDGVAADRVLEISATLSSSGWSGASAPYTQTVNVAGISASSHVFVGVATSASDAQFEAACAALLRFSAGSGTLTAKAYGEEPEVSIPLILGVIS